MKTRFLSLVVYALVLLPAHAQDCVVTSCPPSKPHKERICHWDADMGIFIPLEVSESSLAGHMRHHDVIAGTDGLNCECIADCDADGVPDELDGCPFDPKKTAPGTCGCGIPDTDSDEDGVPDCLDGCPNDPTKTDEGICGCGAADTDSDNDGTADCVDRCASDPAKTEAGICGCGVSDVDSDGDGIADCLDGCPYDPGKTEEGVCGCGVADGDSDGDSTPDCIDGCPEDPTKTDSETCGCGVPDSDSDGDGVADCIDECPSDPYKLHPGVLGCNVPDSITWPVDSQGGTLCLSSEHTTYCVQIQIPEGALSNPTLITCVVNPPVSSPAIEDIPLGLQLTLLPDDVVFSLPLVVEVSYLDEDNDGLEDTTGLPEDYLRVWLLNTGPDEAQLVEHATVRSEQNKILFETVHFSSYGIYFPTLPDDVYIMIDWNTWALDANLRGAYFQRIWEGITAWTRELPQIRFHAELEDINPAYFNNSPADVELFRNAYPHSYLIIHFGPVGGSNGRCWGKTITLDVEDSSLSLWNLTAVTAHEMGHYVGLAHPCLFPMTSFPCVMNDPDAAMRLFNRSVMPQASVLTAHDVYRLHDLYSMPPEAELPTIERMAAPVIGVSRMIDGVLELGYSFRIAYFDRPVLPLCLDFLRIRPTWAEEYVTHQYGECPDCTHLGLVYHDWEFTVWIPDGTPVVGEGIEITGIGQFGEQGNSISYVFDDGDFPREYDVDGDGYWKIGTYVGDCDDSDESVHPGAAEVCGDMVDNNCDGTSDEGCDILSTEEWKVELVFFELIPGVSTPGGMVVCMEEPPVRALFRATTSGGTVDMLTGDGVALDVPEEWEGDLQFGLGSGGYIRKPTTLWYEWDANYIFTVESGGGKMAEGTVICEVTFAIHGPIDPSRPEEIVPQACTTTSLGVWSATRLSP